MITHCFCGNPFELFKNEDEFLDCCSEIDDDFYHWCFLRADLQFIYCEFKLDSFKYFVKKSPTKGFTYCLPSSLSNILNESSSAQEIIGLFSKFRESLIFL